ncbi:MAG TPA: Ig-like domain-containing protein, partial [Fibrobacteria bacterium]|nr:Ig-like domain-containing protein [Fibrobacteria bacterium]
MRQMTRRRTPWLALFLMLLASTLMFCEPGKSLESTVPDNTAADTGKVAVIAVSAPQTLLPGDTALVRVSVVDSVDSLPMEGARVAISSSQFALLDPSGPGKFSLESLPADGEFTFRIAAANAGTGTITVRITAGERLRTRSFQVTVPEAPTGVQIQESFPDNLKSGDTVTLSFIVVDTATKPTPKPLNRAALVFSGQNLSILGARSRDALVVDTTSSDGKVEFRVVAQSSAGKNATLTVQVRTGAGLTRTDTYNFAVDEVAGIERPRSLVFTAVRATLRADGSDSTELRVLVKDDKNNPLQGELIKFTSTGGLVAASAESDAWGRASTILISERVNKTVVVTATLEKTGATAKQTVAFDGVTISILPAKKVLMVDNENPIIFELRDGGNVPMSGDSLEIAVTGAYQGFGKASGSGPDTQVVVTDTRGQYRTSITCKDECTAVLSARALGARSTETVTFTNKKLILTSNKASLIGNGTDLASLTAKLTNGSGAAMSDIEMRWTTTFGDFASTPFTRTGSNGESSINLRAAYGSGLATVNVEAYDSDRNLVTSGNIDIPVKPLKVARVAFKVTPDNIPVKVGEAKMIALAYDSAGNMMSDVLVGFKMIKGAGGGDEVLTPPVAYTRSGTAEGVFKAGGIISQYRGVQLAAVALDIVGSDTLVIASSDTLGLTVSGPPHKVSVGVNIEKGLNPEDGTFGLPTAAVVTDVNGNLVADGVPVNFSTTPLSALVTYRSWTRTNTTPWWDTVNMVMELPWTDHNDNRRLDAGERASAFNSARPYRGEDRDGNGVILFAPDRFDDVNGNGIFDSYQVEPTIIGIHSSGVRDTTYPDINFNGRQDSVETM